MKKPTASPRPPSTGTFLLFSSWLTLPNWVRYSALESEWMENTSENWVRLISGWVSRMGAMNWLTTL